MSPARILRLLATNHIFIEMTPDVFSNNRLSSVLDTGKSVEELLERLAGSSMVRGNLLTIVSPEWRHVGTYGMASIIERIHWIFYIIQILMCFFGRDEGFI